MNEVDHEDIFADIVKIIERQSSNYVAPEIKKEELQLLEHLAKILKDKINWLEDCCD